MNNLTQDENTLFLNVILNSQIKYDRVYFSYQKIFTNNVNAVAMLLDHLENKHFILLLFKVYKHSIAKYAKSYGYIVPTNIILDEEIDAESISAQLNKLISLAKEVGIVPRDAQEVTLIIEIISQWALYLKYKGVKLVPVSPKTVKGV